MVETVVFPTVEVQDREGEQVKDLPLMYRVKQHFETSSLENLDDEVKVHIQRILDRMRPKPGGSVAIAVGSRGIHHISGIVKVTVECLLSAGLRPFIIPAMGSHGGATAEGQVKVLEKLGITESATGAPIVSSMEVDSLGEIQGSTAVFISRDALKADHLFVINRVKPHTAFRGDVESGLCKMLAIGCGKHRGASEIHRRGLGEFIVPAAELILKKVPVLGGLALVENPMGETSEVRGALPGEFVEVDRELLRKAWELMPRIPLEQLDVLIVDEMGKDISGAGMDPNIIGFWRREGGPRRPDYRTLVVLDLTDASQGNATGIGMADLTTKRLLDKIDINATYENALTSGVLRSARIPIALKDDRAALEAAFRTVPSPKEAKVVRIRNTLELHTFWASESLLPELKAMPKISVEDNPSRFRFDAKGRLLSFDA
jgi:hypothetical protein